MQQRKVLGGIGGEDTPRSHLNECDTLERYNLCCISTLSFVPPEQATLSCESKRPQYSRDLQGYSKSPQVTPRL